MLIYQLLFVYRALQSSKSAAFYEVCELTPHLLFVPRFLHRVQLEEFQFHLGQFWLLPIFWNILNRKESWTKFAPFHPEVVMLWVKSWEHPLASISLVKKSLSFFSFSSSDPSSFCFDSNVLLMRPQLTLFWLHTVTAGNSNWTVLAESVKCKTIKLSDYQSSN